MMHNNSSELTGKVMVQVVPASELTLHDVKEKFNLQQVQEQQFFWEWQDELDDVLSVLRRLGDLVARQ